MKNKKEYILMYEDDEVLSFSVDFKNRKIKVLKKLEHFDKAPLNVKNEETNIDSALLTFFNVRAIAPQRHDYQDILNATGCKNYFELSFKGHGLSLANHYWYKKEGENLKFADINFLTNKWDDSFARAVLKGDYEALKTCDLNVPDIVTPGWGVKGWIYDNGPKLYKLGIQKDHYEENIGEVLASKLIQRLLNDGEVVKYELVKINDKYASVSPLMIDIDEELIPLSDVLSSSLLNLFHSKQNDKNALKLFFEQVKELKIPGVYDFFVKQHSLRTLCFISDLHCYNVSVIRNLKTGEMRMAPLYDLAGAFGSSRSGRETISNFSKGTYLVVYYLFSGLDPDWDYSWYDPNKLIGFEEEIRDMLSKSSFYTPELIERIISVYHQQIEYLNKVAKK